jgi:hypothetical protein
MKKTFFVLLFVFIAMSVMANDFHLFFDGAGRKVPSSGYDVYGTYRYEVFVKATSEPIEEMRASYERLYKVTYLQPTPIISENVLAGVLYMYRPLRTGTILHITIWDGDVLFPDHYCYLLQITGSGSTYSYVFFKLEDK